MLVHQHGCGGQSVLHHRGDGEDGRNRAHVVSGREANRFTIRIARRRQEHPLLPAFSFLSRAAVSPHPNIGFLLSPLTLLTGRSPHLFLILRCRGHPWPWRRQRSIKPLAGAARDNGGGALPGGGGG